MKVLAPWLIVGLLGIAVACSKADDRGEGADGSEAGQFALAGVWSGSANSSLEGSELTDVSAKMTFEVDGQNTNGNFELTIPDLEGATSTGTFQDFMGKSLLFTVVTSNISSFGLSGVSTFDYEMTGNALLLTNNRMKLSLLRQGEGPNNTGNGDGGDNSGNGSNHRLEGTWQCLTELGNTWVFKINGNGYKGNIKDVAVYFSGTATPQDTDNILLEADSTSDEPYDTYVMLMTATSDINAKMVATRRGSNGSSQLTCYKQPYQ